MSSLNVGIYTKTALKALRDYKAIKELDKDNNTEFSLKYYVYDFCGLSMQNFVDSSGLKQLSKKVNDGRHIVDDLYNRYSDMHKTSEIQKTSVTGALEYITDNKDANFSIILQLDNLFDSYIQLKENIILNEILDWLNKTDGYVKYSNYSVEHYLTDFYPNIKKIRSSMSYKTDNLDFLEDENNFIEVNINSLNTILPLIEYDKLNPDKVFIFFTSCKNPECVGKKRCYRYKSMFYNRTFEVLDIVSDGFKYMPVYKDCFLSDNTLLTIPQLKETIIRTSKFGIKNYCIQDRMFDTDTICQFFCSTSLYTRLAEGVN